MSEIPNQLPEEFKKSHSFRFRNLVRKIDVPEKYHPCNLITNEDYAKSGDIVASLEHTFNILHSYGESENLTDDQFIKFIAAFRITATIPGFWQACESHGNFIATKGRTLQKGALKDFIAAIDDDGLALKAYYLLQSLSLAHGDDENQSLILRDNFQLIGELIQIDAKHAQTSQSFNLHFLKILFDCVSKLELCSVIPCNKSEIDEAAKKNNGRDISRSIWISHHLWLMDINTRTRYVESLTEDSERTLRLVDELWSQPQICGIASKKYQFAGERIKGLFPLPV